jgi:hypothetical protein
MSLLSPFWRPVLGHLFPPSLLVNRWDDAMIEAVAF